MADDTSNTWFSELLAGRSKGECEQIKRFVESVLAVKDEEHEADSAVDARNLASRLRFDRAFSDWLRAQSIQAHPGNPDGVADCAQEFEADAVRRLIGEPARLDWQLQQKFEILDHYLDSISDDWEDRRFTRLFHSVKADIKNLDTRH